MTTQTKTIENRLAKVRGRIRRVQWMRAWMLVAMVFLAGLLVLMACDLAFAPLASAARWGLFAAWLIALVWSALVAFSPLRRPLRLVQIARWLEDRHPEMEERLSTALEVSGQAHVSPQLLESLVEAADKDAEAVDPRREVKAGGTTRRWRRAVLACTVVLLAALALQPATTLRLLVRAVAPFSTYGNAGAASFDLRPGSIELLEGDALEITLDYYGPGTPELVLESANGTTAIQPLVRSGAAWTFTLEPVREDLRYRARAGRAVSDQFRVKVWPFPRAGRGEVVLDFPDYTGLPTKSQPLTQPVEAVSGTTVQVTGELNTPAAEARMTFENRPELAGRIEGSGSRTRFDFQWPLKEAGDDTGTVWVKHRLGREVSLTSLEVRTTADQPPAVTLLSPVERKITARPDEVLDLRYEVSEDFGISSLAVEVVAGNQPSRELAQVLPGRVAGSDPPRYLGVAPVSLGALAAEAGNTRQFRLRVVARDTLPATSGGPGVGVSDWLVVRLDEAAESLARQSLLAEHSDARETLEKALRETREAESRMHQNRHALEEGRMNRGEQKRAEETRDKLASAAENLQELARRTEESVHAAQAEEVRKSAERVAESLQAFEEIPLFDERDARHEKLEEAIAAAREAAQSIEKARNEINRDRPQVEDLARLEELAQQQRELARQAQEQATQASDKPMESPWQQSQEQLANELRNQLHQRPDALAAALNQQAQEARDLAEDARETAKAQAELEKMTGANEPSASPANAEDLRQAVAREQERVADEARAQAHQTDQPEQAATQAKEAAQELQENRLPEAAQSAREAATAMTAAARENAETELARKGDAQSGESSAEATESSESNEAAEAMASLAEQQEHLAEAAEALAEGNTEAAAQALAAAQEEANNSMEEKLAELLAAEQSAIAEETAGMLAEARLEGSPLADTLPESAAATESAHKALAEASNLPEAAASAQAAATALEEMAGAAARQAEAATETGSPAEAAQAAAAREQLDALSARQENLAEAAQALAEGGPAEALAQMQESQAAQARGLAEEIASLPHLAGSPLPQAAQQAREGSAQAENAATQGAQGDLPAAADSHARAQESFAQAARTLEEAADHLASQATQAAARPQPDHLAPIGADPLAKAFQESGQAAASPTPAQAAQHATKAAQALAQAAQQGRAQMQGRGQQRQPPGPPGQDEPQNQFRQREGERGLPAELARLGITEQDWEKIRASLQADVGAPGARGLPEDYRELVREYFERMADQ